MRINLSLLIACTALALPACNADHEVDGHEQAAEEGAEEGAEGGAEEGAEEGGHTHDAPHAHAGGILVELGDHFLQMEVLPDSETGELRLFFWDGHAENPVRLTQTSIQLALTLGGETMELALSAQASTLTGETVGDSAEFRGKHARLKGATDFHAVVRKVEALGASFESIPFDYSRGDN